MKLTKLIPVMVLFLILTVIGASALPIEVNKIEVDGVELEPNDENRLDLERGEVIPIDVYFTVTEEQENMEVMAFISGYEYNNVAPATDSAGPFHAETGVKYHKKLKIKLSEDFEEDDYKLRIIIADRYGEETILSYNLKVDVPRHKIIIQDVILNPELTVKAGSALLAQVRLENKGEKFEDDIKVRVAIPELEVSGVDYIDEIEDDDDSEETEEIYLRIPECAKQGVYNLEVTVEYANGREEVSTSKAINVQASDRCEGTSSRVKTTITVGKQLENIKQGETAIYPITITNNQAQSKSFSLTLDAGDWAENIKLTPGNTVIVKAGESQTIYIHATADSKVAGAKTIMTSINSEGKTVKQVSLTANIAAKSISWIKLGLEAIVIALALLVILIAIVVGYLKLRENNGSQGSETYY